MQTKSISHTSHQRFIASLDIGDLHQTDGHSDVTRTVTALITMIIDLNLKVPSLKENMIWFQGDANQYVVEFSDDGAPESGEGTTTLETLSQRNFGNRIQSRDFHDLLHTISAPEKDKVCEFLWMQSCDKMQLTEGNVTVINGETCTFQLYPAADNAWLYLAYNQIMSEPLHLEINSLQYLLDALYKEAIGHGQFKQFIKVLWSPLTLNDLLRVKGCGLSYIAK